MAFRSPAQGAGISTGTFASAVAVLAAGAMVLLFVELGPLSIHMAAHIALMSIAAPLLAAIWRWPPSISCRCLWIATVCQSGVLWAAHSPALHSAMHADPLLLAGVHAALFLSALAFWKAVVAATSPWQVMLALLLTGKLACLLGVLFVFAPRPLFAIHGSHGVEGMPASATLADQHLAGLLMIVACPLSYVLAAIVIAWRTIVSLEKANATAFGDISLAERA
jgi:putative membrane protein